MPLYNDPTANNLWAAIQAIANGGSPGATLPPYIPTPGDVFNGGLPPGATSVANTPFTETVNNPWTGDTSGATAGVGNAGANASNSGAATDATSQFGAGQGGQYPWSGVAQNNPTYPYALWGGKDNFDAQKPPDWMVKMVDDALAMPDGKAKMDRIEHILSNIAGMPDYLVKYLKSRLT